MWDDALHSTNYLRLGHANLFQAGRIRNPSLTPSGPPSPSSTYRVDLNRYKLQNFKLYTLPNHNCADINPRAVRLST